MYCIANVNLNGNFLGTRYRQIIKLIKKNTVNHTTCCSSNQPNHKKNNKKKKQENEKVFKDVMVGSAAVFLGSG